MVRRRLGQSDLSVAPLSFGGNVFGWTADEPTSFAILDAYVNGGGNFIDTADSYSVGQSERILGRWMSERKNRDRLIIATKVGSQMGTDVNARGLSRQHILAALLCKAHRGRFSHMSEARGDQLRPAL